MDATSTKRQHRPLWAVFLFAGSGREEKSRSEFTKRGEARFGRAQRAPQGRGPKARVHSRHLPYRDCLVLSASDQADVPKTPKKTNSDSSHQAKPGFFVQLVDLSYRSDHAFATILSLCKEKLNGSQC